MGTSRKQKRVFRVRQKIADRQPSKTAQIQQLIERVDKLPIHPLTGQVMYPQSTKEK